MGGGCTKSSLWPQGCPHPKPMGHPLCHPKATLSPRTQLNFTVAIDFTASNGEWGLCPPRGIYLGQL